MIKLEKQILEINNEQLVPSHWRIISNSPHPFPNTKRIIPIGFNNNRFHKMIIDSIKSAKERIMLCSFLLSDIDIINSLIEASERNVRCYLLFSTEAQLSKEYKDNPTDFDKKSLENHKEFLNRIAGKMLARTSAHLHAKFLLIDPETDNEKGFMSTANFTTEALKRNLELGIILNAEEIKSTLHFFNIGFWEESENELIERNNWDDVKKRKIKPLDKSDKVVCTTSRIKSLKESLEEIINSTKGRLIVSSFGFDVSHRVMELLKQKAEMGNLIILTRPREKNLPAINALYQKGAKIIGYEFLHSKFILACDEGVGIVMTANVENRGLDTGYELGIKIYDKDAKELSIVVDSLLRNPQLIWEPEENLKFINEGSIKIHTDGQLKIKEVVNELTIELQDEKPKDLKDMKKILKEFKVKRKDWEKKVPTDKLPKKVRLIRKVIPPALPQDAEKVNQNEIFLRPITKGSIEKSEIKEERTVKFPFQVYRKKKQYYIVVDSWKELEKLYKYEDLLKKDYRVVIRA